MKIRLSILLWLTVNFLFPISINAHKTVYEHGPHPHPLTDKLHEWTNKEGKSVKAKFSYFSESLMELGIMVSSGKEFAIKYEDLSEESQKLVRKIQPEPKAKPAPPPEPKPEPQFIPKDAAQKILLARIENLERIVMQLDQRNQKLDQLVQNFVNANPVAQKQQSMPKTTYFFNGQQFDNHNDWSAAQSRQRELDRIQEQMDIIKFNQMSGSNLLIP